MFNEIKTILLYSGTTKTNCFIYFLKSIPLIKNLLSDEFYSFFDIKKFISIIMFIISTLTNIAIKLIYMLFVGLLINRIFLQDIISPNGDKILFVFSISLFSIVGGLLGSSVICNPKQEKTDLIKLLRMPSSSYCKSKFIIECFNNIILFIPSVIFVGLLLKVSILQIILLGLNIILSHIICEVIHMKINKKFNIVLGSKLSFSILYITTFVLSYILIIFYDMADSKLNTTKMFGDILTSIPITLILLALSIYSIYFIFKYKNYRSLVDRSLSEDEIKKVSVKLNSTGENNFKDVKLKDDKDININNKSLSKYTGYEYFNAIFFERHKRILIKPIVISISIIYGITVLTALIYFLLEDFSTDIKSVMNNFFEIYPIIPFLVYILTLFSSERATRAMFYNCDINMLHHNYYRTPEVILQNFKIRLKKLFSINTFLTASVCMCYIILMIITSTPFVLIDSLLFFISLISLGAFFSIYHLFNYYIFQPFTSDLKAKNPFYTLINIVVYIIFYVSMQIQAPLTIYALVIIICSVTYCILALKLVYKFAPKTFRIK